MKNTIIYGLAAIILGLLLIFGSLYWEAETKPSANRPVAASVTAVTGDHSKEATRIEHPQSGIIPVFIKLIETVGVTLFGIGLLNIVLETRDWREYFENRVQHLIMEQSYLNGLDKEALQLLQVRALKAQYKDEKIDHEGSFLNYFHSNLHQYIAEPYREDVTVEMLFRRGKDQSWDVFDRVTYVCRRSAAGIQPNIRWVPDRDEFKEVRSITIDIQYPYNHDKKGTCETLASYTKENLPDEGVSVSLENYKDVDGLIVIMTANYSIDGDRFQYWTMAHPTRNFDVTLTFPDEYEIQIKPLVLNPEVILTTQHPGYRKVKYDSWMLPTSGLAWRIISKNKTEGDEATQVTAG
jgi:hypothetical protein